MIRLFLLGVALLVVMGGCVNSTKIQHADGTWTIVTRNPALLDGNLVMTAHYDAGDEPLVMRGEPTVALGPSIIGQVAMPVAYVWGQHERSRGTDEVNVKAVGSTGRGGAGGAGGVDGQSVPSITNHNEINNFVEIDNDPGNDWPSWPDDD
jgi:hypothetical protein